MGRNVEQEDSLQFDAQMLITEILQQLECLQRFLSRQYLTLITKRMKWQKKWMKGKNRKRFSKLIRTVVGTYNGVKVLSGKKKSET